ncbi:uncharacterized protein EAF02_000424 [Botrytis sinoallii]|uniref:uncharacterized protein n=1 Tax=Botrytis sinoallii TaxID=1463999 RepID=UPI001901212A|nr:uncharacterized protein EAF02_000424 [Botrytis sinoallii]KAF7892886.1 hypothetical protein EAF02_000424 [Botrytis sinoallii]
MQIGGNIEEVLIFVIEEMEEKVVYGLSGSPVYRLCSIGTKPSVALTWTEYYDTVDDLGN